MASLSGVLNGADVLIQLEDSEGGGIFSSILGTVTSDEASSYTPIGIDNKASGGAREFLEGEGKKQMDLTVNAIFNTDASFTRAKTVHRDKLGVLARVVFGAVETWEGRVIIPTASFSAPNEEKYEGTFTLLSTGDYAWT